MKPMFSIGYNRKISIGITSELSNNYAISTMIPFQNGSTSALEPFDPTKKAQRKSATI
jgi:hypothetical protein